MLDRHFRKGCSGGEVINPGFWIHNVKRLPQVPLSQQIAAQATDISELQREPVWQLPTHGEIEGVSVRRLQRLIDSPSDGLNGCRGMKGRRR